MISGFGPAFLISLVVAVLLCVHAVRTGQQPFWLWVILIFQPLGGIVYFAAVLLPGLLGGRAARQMGQAARQVLDPERDYRAAKAAYEDTPSVQAMLRLAQAAGDLERWSEAEALYRQAAQGFYAEDPVLVAGHGRALVELRRDEEALEVLQRLGPLATRSAAAVLSTARALDRVGRAAEADAAYRMAVERLPGLEAMARHAAFLRRTGREADAQAAFEDIGRRADRAQGRFRAEARRWRDFAAQALSTPDR